MQKSDETAPTGGDARPRPRGRPRAFDRDAALEQAMRIFWRKGYDAASINDLTRAMGIGSPSLYAAFGSKEALYLEALRRYQTTFGARAFDMIEVHGPIREALQRYLLAVAEALPAAPADRPPGCMVTLASVCRDEHAELNARLQAERGEALRRVEGRVSRAVAEGELPSSVDARALARFVVTVVSGLSIQARDGATGAELADVVRIAMRGWDAMTGGGA